MPATSPVTITSEEEESSEAASEASTVPVSHVIQSMSNPTYRKLVAQLNAQQNQMKKQQLLLTQLTQQIWNGKCVTPSIHFNCIVIIFSPFFHIFRSK